MEHKRHIPVAAQQVVDYLVPAQPGDGVFFDCTFGHGGHSKVLLEHLSPTARVIGCDCDEAVFSAAPKELLDDPRLRLRTGNYAELVAEYTGAFDGVIADFGARLDHFLDPERGMSFMHEAPLDMRFDRSQPVTAAELVNSLAETELAELLRDLGDEQRAESIAAEIVRRRKVAPLKTTTDLVSAIHVAMSGREPRGRSHFATRTFQALRLSVNNELANIAKLIAALPRALKPGGRVVAITYHSLEQKCVIAAIYERRKAWRSIKRNSRPMYKEIQGNPQARSARINVFEYCPDE